MWDRNLNANVFDPSVDYLGAGRQAAPQMPVAARSNPQQGVGGQGGTNPLMQVLAALLMGGGQQAQSYRPDPAAQSANAWGNQMRITPENQWDSRWELLNNNSPLGQMGRASLRQDYGGGQEVSSQAPGAGPYLGTEAQRPKWSGTNWESSPAGGGGLVYSGSQVPDWERGAVKNVDPNYDLYMRNQGAMAGYW